MSSYQQRAAANPQQPKNKSLFRITVRVIAAIMRCCPGYFIGTTIIGLIMGGGFAASLLATQYVFDHATDLATGTGTILAIIMGILFFALVMVAQEVLNGLYDYRNTIMTQRLHGFFCKMVAEKAAKLDVIQYEDPQVLDDINKTNGVTHLGFGVAAVMANILTFYLPSLVFIGIYLQHLNPLLVWAIVFAFIPKLAAVLLRIPLYRNLEDKSAALRRESEFMAEAMTDRVYFAETRMLGATQFFRQRYLTALRVLNRETWRTDARSATVDLIFSMLTLAGYVGILYLLFISLRSGYITVGAFAAVFANVGNLISMIDSLIEHNLGYMTYSIGRVGYLFDFFDLPERGGVDTPVDWSGTIELRDVSFTYPGVTAPSLDKVTLQIIPGETLAIVGENGAGKTTLTKMLLGLYRPDSGSVIVGGQDTYAVHPNSLHKGSSAVFQQFQRYVFTLAENIEMSEVDSGADVFPSLAKAGVDWRGRAYPDGVDTLLSRRFDGVDVSGGQWQRIAIARGLYRNHDLVVLDEPTSAIDPIEESRLYDKFAQLAAEKTAIIVTHRMGSAKIADRIVVMDNGQIVEIGTHNELMQYGGKYALMYQAQEQWYLKA